MCIRDSLISLHTQIGVDDCSTNLSLRGLPVFRGLIGPMSIEKDIVRYESPDVFEALTKEWVADQPHKKKRRRKSAAKPATDVTATTEATEKINNDPAPTNVTTPVVEKNVLDSNCEASNCEATQV